MIENVRLSRRETEVLELLLEGKSNKQIAGSLDISIRTVEFHLKNVYAKFQVTSRIELILKLGNAPGNARNEKLGYSTVEKLREKGENRERFNSDWNWTTSTSDGISVMSKELAMKSLLSSKHVSVGVLTALSTGVLWVATMLYSQTIPPYEFKGLTAPLIFIWAIIGLSVGVIGRRTGNTVRRVFFSALFSTGLSPFLIIPLMIIVVLPLGKLAAWLGLIDPATMSSEVATILGKTAMVIIWIVVGLTIGITLLFVTIKKLEPQQDSTHSKPGELHPFSPKKEATMSRKLRVLSLTAVAVLIVSSILLVVNWLSARRQTLLIAVPQQQIEQRAVEQIQGWVPASTITQIHSRRTTLGQLIGQPLCSAPQVWLGEILVVMTIDTYNPCDPQTAVWVVDLDGVFNFPQGSTNHAQVVFDATGYFIRADSP